MESLEHSVSASSAHSIQEALRLGKSRDIWYYDSKTTSKQSIPSVVDTRFYQELNNLTAGSSTFIISIDQGISDVILGVKLPEQNPPTVDYTNLGLPRGWIYSLINRISIRYGSSSQYFWTGGQLLVENLREMPNPTTRDQMFELGGVAMTTLANFAGDNMYAYAYLNVPHSSPNGSMAKPNPFPSELIGQPIVVTLELNQLSSIFSTRAALGSLAGAPSQLESGYFQVRQVHAKDTGELMTMPGGRSVAYSFPTKCFYQNEIQIKVGNRNGVVATPTKYQSLLTGFRNGEVRSIFFWVTKDSDTDPQPTNVPYVKNFTEYILPKDIELLYNGTVYYRALGPSAQMWSLVTTETPPQLECTVLTYNAGPPTTITSATQVANWVEIPFSQVFEQLSGSHMYVSGKLIQNAVVNLNMTLPDTDAYTIHAVYSYNCALMISDRQCEYAF